MKKTSLLFLGLIFMSSLSASPTVDRKIGVFVNDLKNENYAQGLEKLLKNTALEEKVLNVSQTKNNWQNQFIQIKSIYGNYLDYEKVLTKKLGKLEETYYFVYCQTYVIQLIVTEYNVHGTIDIINFEFNDQILDTLNAYGDATSLNN